LLVAVSGCFGAPLAGAVDNLRPPDVPDVHSKEAPYRPKRRAPDYSSMREYGEVVARARGAKGLSQNELARKVGTRKGYIAGIENGLVNPPSVAFSNKLAKVLGLDPLDLLRRATVQKAPKVLRAELACLLFPKECS
jgi:ribosome-binding protein aMBF1 (putative translation factor)